MQRVLPSNVVVVDHPVIKHKIGVISDKNTSNKDFREVITEISALIGYKVFEDLPLEEIEVETPVAKGIRYKISGRKPALIPIMRAGMGLIEGLHSLVPVAKVGHIGIFRDKETAEPHEYYCKLPKDIEDRLCIVCEIMLATGGSAISAINMLKERGVTNIKFIAIICAREGLERLAKAHPDIAIYVTQIDEELNNSCYIVPGCGDAGCRLWGTN